MQGHNNSEKSSPFSSLLYEYMVACRAILSSVDKP